MGEKIDIDAAEDVRILILLWKLGVGGSNAMKTSSSSSSKTNGNTNDDCFQPGQIQATEWKTGCKSLHIDSWESFQSIVPSLDLGFLDAKEFRDFYRFCFRFNLTGTHRTLDSELAVALLRMIFDSTTNEQRINRDRLDTFCSFLEHVEHGKSYQRLTLDQWLSFYDFCQEIPSNSDLIASAYDESTSAWPVMIDEYVEYIQKQLKG